MRSNGRKLWFQAFVQFAIGGFTLLSGSVSGARLNSGRVFLPDLPYVGHEAVAASGDRFDVMVVNVFAQHLPQNGDLLGQTDLFDNGIRPNLLQQVFLVQDVSTAFDQSEQ